MKRFAAAAVVLVLAASAGAARAGEEKPASHPHFNDGGTLSWFTRLADARTAAKKAGKLIFIEFGREA
jgi:hypothetical protein